MNSADCLSKDRHDPGIGGISAGELHVVGKLIRRYALQHKLTGISIFAFIALQWNSQQPNPNCDNEDKDDRREKPPCASQYSVAVFDFTCHECWNPCKKWQVANLDSTRAMTRPSMRFRIVSRSAGIGFKR